MRREPALGSHVLLPHSCGSMPPVRRHPVHPTMFSYLLLSASWMTQRDFAGEALRQFLVIGFYFSLDHLVREISARQVGKVKAYNLNILKGGRPENLPLQAMNHQQS